MHRLSSSKNVVSPVGWLTELFGPFVRQTISDWEKESIRGDAVVVWGKEKVKCIHEEGGKRAIFEYSNNVGAVYIILVIFTIIIIIIINFIIFVFIH